MSIAAIHEQYQAGFDLGRDLAQPGSTRQHAVGAIVTAFEKLSVEYPQMAVPGWAEFEGRYGDDTSAHDAHDQFFMSAFHIAVSGTLLRRRALYEFEPKAIGTASVLKNTIKGAGGQGADEKVLARSARAILLQGINGVKHKDNEPAVSYADYLEGVIDYAHLTSPSTVVAKLSRRIGAFREHGPRTYKYTPR